MANRFYTVGSDGKLILREFTQTSAGATDSGKGVGLNESGVLDATLMPPGIAAEVQSVEAEEGLAEGNYVNIYWSSGDSKLYARKADASGGIAKQAHGFVLANVSLGSMATVYLPNSGINNKMTGLTPGTKYFLSATTPGDVETTPPAFTNSGYICQAVGVALAETKMSGVIETPIEIE